MHPCTQDDRSKYLFVEHGLCLPTITALLTVVPPLSLGEYRIFAFLVLSDFMGCVFFASFALAVYNVKRSVRNIPGNTSLVLTCPTSFGDVDHFERAWRWRRPGLYSIYLGRSLKVSTLIPEDSGGIQSQSKAPRTICFTWLPRSLSNAISGSAYRVVHAAFTAKTNENASGSDAEADMATSWKLYGKS
jgi:hypothetical protein